MNRIPSLAAAALTCLALALPAPALASGGVRKLSLKDAVNQATYVLVVKKAAPARETVQVPIPYQKGGKKLVEKMGTTYLSFKVIKRLKLAEAARGVSWTGRSFLHPDREVTVKLDEQARRGKVVRVVSSRTVTNNHVRARYLRDGTQKIPLYLQLVNELAPEEIGKGRRFLLLCRYNLSYEALEGAGGFGLVSYRWLKQVNELLAPPPRQRQPN